MGRPRYRWLVIAALSAGLTRFASANGAMGLALEMFDYAYWWPYVVATVILEAWMIGRGLGDGWPKALGISLCANLITALFCPNICAVGMHQAFVGTTANPNPFLNAVFIFAWFGFISALIESVMWKLRRKEPSDWVIVRKSLLAHAVGVPLALAILLIPSRPYVGLEATASPARNRLLLSALKAYIDHTPDEDRVLSAIKDPPDLLRQFGDGSTWAAYLPDFHRFDFGEAKRIPYQWNQKATGIPIGFDSNLNEAPPPLWLLRVKVNGLYRGYQFDTQSSTVSKFNDKTAAELDADTDALIRIDKEIRKHPAAAPQPGGTN